MLTIYVDESVDDVTGMYVVGGYLGDKKQWTSYVEEWKEALKPRVSLHLSTLRLNSKGAPRRYGPLLERLGTVPKNCALRPFVGSVCARDYKDRFSGTILENSMKGYVLAILALMDELGSYLPHGERVEVIFEQNIVYAELRERAMIFWQNYWPRKAPRGKSLLAKWSSIEKCILTEASDYLCYALHQSDAAGDSQKALLTSPILSQEIVRNHRSKQNVDNWIRIIKEYKKKKGE